MNGKIHLQGLMMTESGQYFVGDPARDSPKGVGNPVLLKASWLLRAQQISRSPCDRRFPTRARH
jgi:hypothetical protein